MLRSCLVFRPLLAPSAHAGSRFGGGGLHAGRGGFHGGGVFHRGVSGFHRIGGRGFFGGYGYGYNCGIGFDCGVPDVAMAMVMAAAREMPSAVAAVPAPMYRIPKAQISALIFPLTAGSAAPLTTHLAPISGRS